MRTVWMSVVIVFTFIVGLMAQVDEQPEEMFEYITPKTQNMGTVLDGTVLKGQIVFRYKGNGPFHIQAVNTSCGCTVVQLKKTTFSTGEVISIPFEINTTGFRGPIQKRIAVYYDQPKSSILVFKVRAIVQPLLEYKPTFVRLTLQPGKTSAVGEIEFKNNSDEPIQITKLENPDSRISATFSNETIAPHKTEKLTVVFNGTVTDNERIVLKFQNSAYPGKWFSIPVYVFPPSNTE